jgi:hypothetical protein
MKNDTSRREAISKSGTSTQDWLAIFEKITRKIEITGLVRATLR